ncbi:MAG: restriction endonuclease subunit S [Candidatus Marinimicrobia bacterium]|nr:restriction endonuclease subunit S [Candidatus Neomarinimicrobiota bacterium]
MTRPLLQNRLKIAQLRKNDVPCLLNQRVGRIIPNDLIDKEFLFQLLRTNRIAYKLESDLLGTDPPNLSIKSFRNINIYLPPLPEQVAITDILSTWDQAIEKMETLIEAKEKAFTVLQKEIIENQKNKSINTQLSKICKVKKGQQLNVTHMEEDGKYYALNGGIAPSGRTNNWNTEANTITISEGGNSCGFVSLNRERFWSGGHCYSLESVHNNINIDYLFYYLKYYEPKIKRLRVGSGLPNIQKRC